MKKLKEHPPSIPQRAWDRWDGESSRAWSSFNSYLTLGPDRGIKKLYERAVNNKDTIGYGSSGFKPSLSSLNQWSKKYSWVARSQAYDDHLLQSAQSAHEKKIVDAQKEVIDEELKAARVMFELANKLADAALQRGAAEQEEISKSSSEQKGDTIRKVSLKPMQIAVAKLPALCLAASELMRRAANMPTSVRALEVTGKNGGAVQIEAQPPEINFDDYSTDQLFAIKQGLDFVSSAFSKSVTADKKPN